MNRFFTLPSAQFLGLLTSFSHSWFWLLQSRLTISEVWFTILFSTTSPPPLKAPFSRGSYQVHIRMSLFATNWTTATALATQAYISFAAELKEGLVLFVGKKQLIYVFDKKTIQLSEVFLVCFLTQRDMKKKTNWKSWGTHMDNSAVVSKYSTQNKPLLCFQFWQVLCQSHLIQRTLTQHLYWLNSCSSAIQSPSAF